MYKSSTLLQLSTLAVVLISLDSVTYFIDSSPLDRQDPTLYKGGFLALPIVISSWQWSYYAHVLFAQNI